MGNKRRKTKINPVPCGGLFRKYASGASSATRTHSSCKRRGVLARCRANLRLINRILLVAVIASGIYFVAGVNELAINGFQLKELKKQISEVNYANRSLESRIMVLESHENFSQKIGELSMVPVEKIEYLSGMSGVVAQR